jgi:quercetin dioxygenase-like cupin family protein
MTTRTLPTTNTAFLPIGKPEPILRRDSREISLLVANESLSLTYASRPAGERVTDAHIHRHAEAFYVLEGELTFEVGADRETITIGAGGFVAVPAGVAHAYGTAGSHPTRWLIIHAIDGGFAAFMRGIRDGVEVEWDIAPVPLDGGLPADPAVSPAVRSLGLPDNGAVPTSVREARCPRTARRSRSERSGLGRGFGPP